MLSQSQTGWKRLDAMTDKDIDLSDSPEITPEMFAHGFSTLCRRGNYRCISLTIFGSATA